MAANVPASVRFTARHASGMVGPSKRMVFAIAPRARARERSADPCMPGFTKHRQQLIDFKKHTPQNAAMWKPQTCGAGVCFRGRLLRFTGPPQPPRRPGCNRSCFSRPTDFVSPDRIRLHLLLRGDTIFGTGSLRRRCPDGTNNSEQQIPAPDCLTSVFLVMASFGTARAVGVIAKLRELLVECLDGGLALLQQVVTWTLRSSIDFCSLRIFRRRPCGKPPRVHRGSEFK